jgi:RNA-directed DNA polymerase
LTFSVSKIKCPNTLWVLDDIIDSCNGLPIGNYTSQYLGNLYLNEFDWWSIKTLKPTGYYRYCDDIVILYKEKFQCWYAKQQMENRLEQKLNLKIKENWKIFPVHKHGLDFVGFNFFPNKTTLRPTIANNFRAKCRQIIRSSAYLPPTKIVNGLMSYWGWVKYVNAKRLWHTHVTPQHLALLNGVNT